MKTVSILIMFVCAICLSFGSISPIFDGSTAPWDIYQRHGAPIWLLSGGSLGFLKNDNIPTAYDYTIRLNRGYLTFDTTDMLVNSHCTIDLEPGELHITGAKIMEGIFLDDIKLYGEAEVYIMGKTKTLCGEWSDNYQTIGTFNVVIPEPATILILLSGLAFFKVPR